MAPLIEPLELQESSQLSNRIQNEVQQTNPNTESMDSTFLPKSRSIVVIATLAGVGLLSSLSTGLLTVGLPRMAQDVELPEHLLLWPSSVYTLTCGSCLLLAGSMADVLGNRLINLMGCFIVSWFMIAIGLSKTGIQLIMFRALQGIAVSLCLPTSVAIVANSVPSGRRRNIGFSCLGFVQPVGFSLGLVLQGFIQDTIGWRFGFYLCGSVNLVLFIVSIYALPPDRIIGGSKWKRLRVEIDWIGSLLACSCLALFSYVLASLTNDVLNIRRPDSIAMLTISLALVPIFIIWEGRQERLGRPALIPNTLWKNTVFTSVCLMVIFSFAVLNAMELFTSLFFQEVQNLSALEASLRILPNCIGGTLVQLFTGLLIHKIAPFYLLIASLILSAGAPLLMALIDVNWPYWYDAFFAQLLTPLSGDILFTVGLLVVSDVFPVHTQALAGAVFNTVAQFGTSIGLTIMAVISSSATKYSKYSTTSPEGLMVGYRASFWAAFAWMVLACLIGSVGLRGMGKIGLKRE